MRILQFLACVTLFSSSVLALPQTSGGHFFSATASVLGSGDLQVKFDEGGVGNGGPDGLVHYTLSSNAKAVYGCINGGGNHPKATNKETVSAAVSGNVALAPQNGRVKNGIVTAPIPSAGSFTCPSGQSLEPISVTYSGIVLTDTTNTVSITISDVTRVFIVV
jgi:hypothetical protein